METDLAKMEEKQRLLSQLFDKAEDLRKANNKLFCGLMASYEQYQTVYDNIEKWVIRETERIENKY